MHVRKISISLLSLFKHNQIITFAFYCPTANEVKDQIRQSQQDHKEGLLSDLDLNSMRQTVVEQAQLRFVVEQTVKRQRIGQTLV